MIGLLGLSGLSETISNSSLADQGNSNGRFSRRFPEWELPIGAGLEADPTFDRLTGSPLRVAPAGRVKMGQVMIPPLSLRVGQAQDGARLFHLCDVAGTGQHPIPCFNTMFSTQGMGNRVPSQVPTDGVSERGQTTVQTFRPRFRRAEIEATTSIWKRKSV